MKVLGLTGLRKKGVALELQQIKYDTNNDFSMYENQFDVRVTSHCNKTMVRYVQIHVP